MAVKKSTVTEPQEGQYWYAECAGIFFVAKIVFIHNDKYYIKSGGCSFILEKDKLIRRWVPNNFWKLFGYK